MNDKTKAVHIRNILHAVFFTVIVIVLVAIIFDNPMSSGLREYEMKWEYKTEGKERVEFTTSVAEGIPFVLHLKYLDNQSNYTICQRKYFSTMGWFDLDCNYFNGTDERVLWFAFKDIYPPGTRIAIGKEIDGEYKVLIELWIEES